jgi:hypothetical protein
VSLPPLEANPQAQHALTESELQGGSCKVVGTVVGTIRPRTALACSAFRWPRVSRDSINFFGVVFFMASSLFWV